MTVDDPAAGTPASAEPLTDPSRQEAVTGFEKALEGLRVTGASVTVRKLVVLLAHHGAEEGKILAEYERIAAKTDDPAARYLVDLVLQDERRHHRMLIEIATAMAWDVPADAESAIPPLGLHIDSELVEASRRMRRFEEEDRRDLQALRRQLRPFEQTTLWALIVDLMLLDTEKHAKIMRFLEHHARAD